MNNKIAIILCGGKGKRLRPINEKIPKPLVLINEKPILDYIINYLRQSNFSKIILATGYKAEKIEKFSKGLKSDVAIECINTGNVDIIERLRAVTKELNEDIFLLYGDTIADIKFSLLNDAHKKSKLPITITRYPLKTKFGIVETDKNGLVISFREKPILDIWYNIGYMLINKNFFTELYNFSTFEGFLEHSAKESKINSFNHTGYHITINTIEELDYAEKNINKIIQ